MGILESYGSLKVLGLLNRIVSDSNIFLFHVNDGANLDVLIDIANFLHPFPHISISY